MVLSPVFGGPRPAPGGISRWRARRRAIKVRLRAQLALSSHPLFSMTRSLRLNKSELIAAIAADTDISKADAGRVVDSALEQITRAMAQGETVQIFGFGSFTVATRAQRLGRNPSTGEQITIKASRVPKFAPTKALKDAVNSA